MAAFFPAAGTTFEKIQEKYETLSLIGEGGNGAVYGGIRRTDGLMVAIKLIPKTRARMCYFVNGDYLEAPFEVMLMQKIGQRTGIISLYDWYSLDQAIVLVLERPAACVDLFDFIQEIDQLDEAQAKHIFKQLVDAAVTMNAADVFHRDIKLENVLIDTSSEVPRVWIIDLGNGCFGTSFAHKNFFGTSGFAPPEVAARGEYKADPTTVWQLGILLYEILHRAHFEPVEFFPERRIDARLSHACQDLLSACLTKDPDARATLSQLQQHPWFH
ncbi:serine/threonine-protein kinase pim-2-like [Syngnathoides biaculeatus]|uniref:serine/threonine-protein kinase pim-2-like n=1 Tax=Syngnathoides biaculeatus TaxID=300417 RepID=UPI002ADDC934|nr:serine/threonine-protein kinase pim-2-like [Syngnathoides biaculeatus]